MGSRFFIKPPRGAFFVVGKLHGEEPGAALSSNREDFDPGTGLGSSTKRELRFLDKAVAAEASSGEVPNSDIVGSISAIGINKQIKYVLSGISMKERDCHNALMLLIKLRAQWKAWMFMATT